MTVEEFLLSVLCDSHHSVRMRMVSIVCGLYSNGDGVTLPSNQHKQIFTDICERLETANLLNVREIVGYMCMHSWDCMMYNWGKPERAPHKSKSCMVRPSFCKRAVFLLK